MTEDSTEFAPAKLNLGLEVLGRRGDGYHALWSLVVFADCGDRLTYQPSETFELVLEGPQAEALQGETENLVERAAYLLAERAGRSAKGRLVLHKNLPVASGIGGGSADAAAALRLLNRMWACNKSEAALRSLGLALGADVPVCVGSRPVVMSDIGERLENAPRLPDFTLVLVNPGVQVSTREVFHRLAAPMRASIPSHAEAPENLVDMSDFLAFLRGHPNHLEEPAKSIAEEIGMVLGAVAATPGCLMSRMSGSGATCFGIFENRTNAEKAVEILRASEPQWWCEVSGLYTAP